MKKKIIIIGICIVVAVMLYRAISPRIYTARLNSAIVKNDVSEVKRLLEKDGDINRSNDIRWLEDIGDTPLQKACIYGNIEIVELLIENGADVNGREWTRMDAAITGVGE
ncbi:MAG: ankyrin repeat domain-containing protein [Suipraeoptans sp.]